MAVVAYPFGHFPFRPAHGDAPADSLHPVALTLDQAMRWYWRVRKWKVVFSASGKLTGSGDFGSTSDTLTVSGASVTTQYIGYNRCAPDGLGAEPQLVIGSSIALRAGASSVAGTVTSTTTAPGGQPASGTVYTSSAADLYLFDGGMTLSGDAYYPSLRLSGGLYAGVTGSPGGNQAYGTLYFVIGGTGTSTIPVTMDGQSFELRGQGYGGIIDAGGMPETTTVSDVVMSIEVTPVEFWSYGGKYDTTTGETL